MSKDHLAPVSGANRAKVVNYAKAQRGKGYKWLGEGPNAFDCSGLTMKAWEQAGVELPHQSGQQAKLLHAVPFSVANRTKLQPGDLVFYYGTLADYSSITHVAMYVERDEHNLRQVVAAIDDHYGVMEHWISWALQPCAFGYVGHS